MKELLFGEIVQQKFHSSEFLQNATKPMVLVVPVENNSLSNLWFNELINCLIVPGTNLKG